MPTQTTKATTTWKILAAIGLLLLVILFLTNALADRLLIFSPENLIFQAEGAYTLADDAQDSLAVFAQSIDLAADVDGYALLAASDAIDVGGQVGTNLTTFTPTLSFTGVVAGDALFVGDVVRLAGQVNGQTVVFAQSLDLQAAPGAGVTACAQQITNTAGAELLPCDRAAARIILNRAAGQLASVWLVSTLSDPALPRQLVPVLPLPLALLLTGVGALGVVMFPAPVSRMSAAVRLSPGRMTLTGVLVALMLLGITAALLVLLAYIPVAGVVLLPVYLLGVVGVALLLLGGWVTVALSIGGWFTRRLTDALLPPVVLAVTGGAVLAVLALVLHIVPWGALIGPLAFLLLGLAGLGASYTTRFGRRDPLV